MSEELAAELADRLRDAHRSIRSMDLPDDEKARAARRLMALSDTAKVDLVSASRRLDRLLAELGEGRVAPLGRDDQAP